MSVGDDVRLEGGRGCVVCINEKIGIKVHGGDMKIRDITLLGECVYDT